MCLTKRRSCAPEERSDYKVASTEEARLEAACGLIAKGATKTMATVVAGAGRVADLSIVISPFQGFWFS